MVVCVFDSTPTESHNPATYVSFHSSNMASSYSYQTVRILPCVRHLLNPLKFGETLLVIAFLESRGSAKNPFMNVTGVQNLTVS